MAAMRVLSRVCVEFAEVVHLWIHTYLAEVVCHIMYKRGVSCQVDMLMRTLKSCAILSREAVYPSTHTNEYLHSFIDNMIEAL